ncbi:MAG: 6,7-dimethyl-8-ribityllumazine synthase [Dehalococcoidia bacterium]
MAELEGTANGAGLRVCVVVARWNGFVTSKLLEGAVNTLRECGLTDDEITTAWVPGSFEVPTAARWAAQSGRYDAIICLGAVIRGETAHFEYVAGGAAEGIARVSHDTGVPVIFGVLTVDNVEQAMARTGGKDGHKGEESARTAIEMANLRRLLT